MARGGPLRPEHFPPPTDGRAAGSRRRTGCGRSSRSGCGSGSGREPGASRRTCTRAARRGGTGAARRGAAAARREPAGRGPVARAGPGDGAEDDPQVPPRRERAGPGRVSDRTGASPRGRARSQHLLLSRPSPQVIGGLAAQRSLPHPQRELMPMPRAPPVSLIAPRSLLARGRPAAATGPHPRHHARRLLHPGHRHRNGGVAGRQAGRVLRSRRWDRRPTTARPTCGSSPPTARASRGNSPPTGPTTATRSGPPTASRSTSSATASATARRSRPTTARRRSGRSPLDGGDAGRGHQRRGRRRPASTTPRRPTPVLLASTPRPPTRTTSRKLRAKFDKLEYGHGKRKVSRGVPARPERRGRPRR